MGPSNGIALSIISVILDDVYRIGTILKRQNVRNQTHSMISTESVVFINERVYRIGFIQCTLGRISVILVDLYRIGTITECQNVQNHTRSMTSTESVVFINDGVCRMRFIQYTQGRISVILDDLYRIGTITGYAE